MTATTPAAPPAHSFVRPLLALLAGLGITVLIVVVGVLIATLAMLRGVNPARFVATPGYLVVLALLNAGGAIAGGITTARITTGRSFYTVFLLATVMGMSGLVPVIKGAPPHPGEPSWFPLAIALLVTSGVLVGGWSARRADSRAVLG